MVEIERVQTGVRMERRLLKVLKGLAEYLDMSLGDLLEGIVLHAFEEKTPFNAATLAVIERLKEVYGLDLSARDSHQYQAREAQTNLGTSTAGPGLPAGMALSANGNEADANP
jgi:hypothetical protein